MRVLAGVHAFRHPLHVGKLAAAIAETTGTETHDLALVLGSGFGAFRDLVEGLVVQYSNLPGVPVPAAVGHAGHLNSAEVGTNRVLIFSGRARVYEGHPIDDVVLSIGAAVRSGCRTVVLTNPLEDVDPVNARGDLVRITDHINLAGLNPLAGPNDDRL